MGTLINNGEVYINIKEFINVLDGIKIDLEEKYKWCINNSEVIKSEEVRNIVKKMTKDDFDLFISKLNLAKNNLEKHLISSLKVGVPVKVTKLKSKELKSGEKK